MIINFKIFEKLSEKELNRILDKINDKGMESLTPTELKKLQTNSDDVKLNKYELINEIKQIVKDYGQFITMGELQAETSPIFKEVGQTIHLIEGLNTETVNIVIYSGYGYNTVIDEYEETYNKLPVHTLETIRTLLFNAIEYNLIEKDI